MNHCQACNTFRKSNEAHGAQLVIREEVWSDMWIELRVCLCCWFVLAFHQQSDRRILECPTSTEKRFVFRIGAPSFEEQLALIRLRRILGGNDDIRIGQKRYNRVICAMCDNGYQPCEGFCDG